MNSSSSQTTHTPTGTGNAPEGPGRSPSHESPMQRMRANAAPERKGQRQRAAWRFALLLLLVAVVALGARLYRLDQPSTWVDELFTVRDAIKLAQGEWTSRPLAYAPTALWLNVAGIDLQSLNPQAYGTWRQIGITESLIRMPSVFIAVIGIVLLSWLSRPIIGHRAALILALLLALSSWHVWVSQMARFYSLQLVLYNLCLLMYYRATRLEQAPQRRALWACAVWLVLAFVTQLTSLMIVALFAGDWLWSRWRRRPVKLGATGWIALSAALLVCAGIIGTELLMRPTTYTGFRGSQQSPIDLVKGTVFLVGITVLPLAVLGIPWLHRLRPRETAYLAIAAVLPVGTFMGLGLIGADVHIRYTFVGLFAWLALAAVALNAMWSALQPRVGRLLAIAPLVAVVGAMLMSLYLYHHTADGYRTRWREAFTWVDAHQKPGEAVAGNTISHIVGRYYLGDPGVIELKNGRALAKSLPQLDQPTWIVLRNDAPTAGNIYGWLNPKAPLQAYFTSRSQPFSAVEVHYYNPAAHQSVSDASVPRSP